MKIRLNKTVAALATGAANASAAGTVGAANAWNSALGTTAGAYQTSQLINSLNKSAYTGPNNYQYTP